MSVQYFKELAAFNVWANSITCTWLEKINDEQWNKEIVSSFKSIYATVLHVVGAEKAWLERLKKELPIFPLVDSFKGSKHELITLWKNVSADLKLFIDSFDENNCTHILSLKDLMARLSQCHITSCLLMSSIMQLITAVS